MSRFRQQFSGQEGSPWPAKPSKEADNASRWADYLNPEAASSPSTSVSWKLGGSEGVAGSAAFQKSLHMESVLQLTEVAEGLLTKMYRLVQLLEYPDPVAFVFSDGFWRAGIIPNFPRICQLVAKKFPENPSKLQLERVS